MNNAENGRMKTTKKTSYDYDKSICVEDFCGYTQVGHFFVQYWADFYPDMMTTYFGGDWCYIPPLHTDSQPTDKVLERWVKYHELMY